jgi:hypothetical protein
MNPPLPSDNDISPEDLPLRHRSNRVREAERIRQEFVQSRKQSLPEASGASDNPSDSNEP